MTQTQQIHLIEGGDKAYFAFDAISSSQLKEWLKSPKHFFEYEAKQATPAMKMGTMFHEMVLSPFKFADKYQCLPVDYDGRSAKGKELVKIAVDQGKEPIKFDIWANVARMSNEVKKHPTLKSIFENPLEIETGFSWDHEAGLKLKCKPDLLYENEQGFISCFDLKKTRDASKKGFEKSLRSFHYEIQAGLYTMGLRKRFGDKFNSFYFVLVEDSHPYGIGIYEIEPDALEIVIQWINRTLWEIQEIIAKELPVYSYSNPEINKGIESVPVPDYLLYQYISNQ